MFVLLLVIHRAFFSFCSNFLPTKIAIFPVFLAPHSLMYVNRPKCVHAIRRASQKRGGTQRNQACRDLSSCVRKQQKIPHFIDKTAQNQNRRAHPFGCLGGYFSVFLEFIAGFLRNPNLCQRYFLYFLLNKSE